MNCWNGLDEDITKSNFLEDCQKGGQKDVKKNRNIAYMLYNIFSDREGREGLLKVFPFQDPMKSKPWGHTEVQKCTKLFIQDLVWLFFLITDFTKKYSNIITAPLF